MKASTLGSASRFVIAAAFALMVNGVAAQEMSEGESSDGARYSVPSEWTMDQPLVIAGTNWLNLAGNAGSTIAVVYDFGAVRAPFEINGDDEVWAVIEADATGAWTYELPFPETANWAVGETHKLHLLSGSLGTNDVARGIAIDVTIIASP